MIESIKAFFEKYAFGVCAWWGNQLGIDPAKIRIYFVYASLGTLGSMLLPYLVMAFLLQIRNITRPKRTRVWDL